MSDTTAYLIRPNRTGGPTMVAWIVLVLAVFFVVIHLYAGFYGSPDSLLFRSLHVCAALILVFLCNPLRRFGRLGRPIDVVLCLGTLWCQTYFLIELDTWGERTVFFRPIDYVTSVLFIAIVLEATRRSVGLILVVICLVFMTHALYANYFPGMFYGPPTTLENLLQSVFLGSTGIFGVAVAVMSQFVVLFILFGTLLNATGGGAFFTRLAFALFGHRVGGPAKAAVISSAMMGSLSGSSIGNVMTTGVFTIPLMIKLGYRRAFAGGVEAAASNGGIIMPPVMGAVAFIMAEFLDRPYLEIIIAAFIPALLYFLVIFVTVHCEAKKLGLRTIEKALLPSPWRLVRQQGYLALPLLLIIGALALGYSIVLVAVVIIMATFVIGVVQRQNRLNPTRLLQVFENTARATVGLSATAAAAGIILGAIFAIGLSFQIAQAASEAAGGQIWLLLIISGVMALVMGMGMTAAAIYITLVATIIPILVIAGVPTIAAHFFAFYYGIISNITPPIALTAYAAAPLAGTGPMQTAFQASRLGAGCFVLPILFIYAPGLLFEGTWWEIVSVSFTSGIGLISFALPLTGYIWAPLPPYQRMVLLLASLLLIFPDGLSDIIGLVLFSAVVGANWLAARAGDADRTAATAAASAGEEAVRVETGGVMARFARARISKDVEAAAETPDLSRKDTDAILAALTDSDTEGSDSRYRSTRLLWAGWIVTAVLAVVMEASGSYFLHARHPLLWVLVMFLMAVVGVVGVVLAARQDAKSDAGDHDPAALSDSQNPSRA